MHFLLDGSPVWYPWFRLYAHAVLCGSQAFPNIEPCDESPDYEPLGFVDILRKNYHGNPVCIKVIRTQSTTYLEKIKKVCDSFIKPELISLHSTLDPLPPSRRVQEPFPSECTPRHSGFGDAVPTLHHESMDARWEHHELHSAKSVFQSVNAGAHPSRLRRVAH